MTLDDIEARAIAAQLTKAQQRVLLLLSADGDTARRIRGRPLASLYARALEGLVEDIGLGGWWFCTPPRPPRARGAFGTGARGMSGVDTSRARQEAQSLREAASRRLGMEAGYLKRKADLIDALRDVLDTATQRAEAAEAEAKEWLAVARLAAQKIVDAETQLATARAAGMEEAARWHDEQAKYCEQRAREREESGWPEAARILKITQANHENSAAAIRAAIHKTEGQSDAHAIAEQMHRESGGPTDALKSLWAENRKGQSDAG